MFNDKAVELNKHTSNEKKLSQSYNTEIIKDMLDQNQNLDEIMRLASSIQFGFDTVKDQKIIVVANIVEALAFHKNGITNVVALGESSLIYHHAHLKEAKVQEIALLFDNTDTGKKAITNTITGFANTDIRLSVISSSSIGPIAEFVLKSSPTALQFLINNAEDAFEYMARAIAQKHKKANGWTNLDKIAAFNEAFEFEKKVTSGARGIYLKLAFWQTFQKLLELEQETLQGLLKQVDAEKAQERRQIELRKLYFDILGHDSSSDIDALEKHILQVADTLRSQNNPLAIKPLLNAKEFLEPHELTLKRYRGKELIGLPQRTIAELDEHLSGLRKLMLLSAAPNTGKTAFTIQISLDVIRNNPDACLLYVSLEIPSEDIFSRMRCYLAKMAWKTLHFGSNRYAIDGQYFNNDEYARLEYAKRELEKIGERILILDSENCPEITIETILAHVNTLKHKAKSKHVVIVIDYLQVFPIPETIDPLHLRSDIAQDNWRIGQMKKLRDAIQQDPVIVITEARKPGSSSEWGGAMSDIMGAARLTYTADQISLITPFSNDELFDGWNSVIDDITWFNLMGQRRSNESKEGSQISKFYDIIGHKPIYLRIVKGRDGMQRGIISLRFHYYENRFEPFDWSTEAKLLKALSEKRHEKVTFTVKPAKEDTEDRNLTFTNFSSFTTSPKKGNK